MVEGILALLRRGAPGDRVSRRRHQCLPRPHPGPARGHVLPAGARFGQPGPGAGRTPGDPHTQRVSSPRPLSIPHWSLSREPAVAHGHDRAARSASSPTSSRAAVGAWSRISRSAADTAGSVRAPAFDGPTAGRRRSSSAVTRPLAAACSSATGTRSGSCFAPCHSLNSVATAPTRWYDSSGDYLGAKCIVMDSVDATSLQAILADSDDIGPLSDLFVDIVATIHGSRLDPLPEGMTRPPDWTSYIDGVLATYDQGGCFASVRRTDIEIRHVVGGRAPSAPGPTGARPRRLSALERPDRRVCSRRSSSTGNSRTSATLARTWATTTRFPCCRTCTGPIQSAFSLAIAPRPA